METKITKKKPLRICIRISIAILVVLLLVMTSLSAASAAEWSYRKPITIFGSQVQGTVTNFPVLIYLSSDSNLAASAQPDGGDIVFTNAANTVRYDHEIEKFVKSTGELVAWVEIDFLASGTDTDIFMWYGNPTVANQWRPADVWDANFLMVQHLQENPDDADPAFKDSTLHANHGTDYGAMTSDDQVAGQIDGSIDFDGVDDFIETPDQGTPPQLTLETWINVGSTDTWQTIIERGSPTAIGWHFFVNNGNRLYSNICGEMHYTPAGSITTNTWHHAVVTWDGSTVRIYIDGTERVSTPRASLRPGGDRVYIGIRSGSAVPFNGIIDEVRISNIARSGDWIKTSFNNQNDPATFYTVGSQESAGPVAPVPDLPAIILFGAGLLVIALYAVRMRRSRR